MRPRQSKRIGSRNTRKGSNILNRTYESNGPDVKVRGTAHHIGEKYLQLARDSQAAGDPIAAENYLQHAEHYFRLIASAQAEASQNNFGYKFTSAEGGEEAEIEEIEIPGLPDRFASPLDRGQMEQASGATSSPRTSFNPSSHFPDWPQSYSDRSSDRSPERPAFSSERTQDRNYDSSGRERFRDRSGRSDSFREGGPRQESYNRSESRRDSPRYEGRQEGRQENRSEHRSERSEFGRSDSGRPERNRGERFGERSGERSFGRSPPGSMNSPTSGAGASNRSESYRSRDMSRDRDMYSPPKPIESSRGEKGVEDSNVRQPIEGTLPTSSSPFSLPTSGVRESALSSETESNRKERRSNPEAPRSSRRSRGRRDSGEASAVSSSSPREIVQDQPLSESEGSVAGKTEAARPPKTSHLSSNVSTPLEGDMRPRSSRKRRSGESASTPSFSAAPVASPSSVGEEREEKSVTSSKEKTSRRSRTPRREENKN